MFYNLAFQRGMHKLYLCLVFGFLLSIGMGALSQSKEVWVEAEGEAAIAGITAEQAMLLALQRARAAAIEKATGVKISSVTLVKDARLSGEFIKAFSKGYIIQEKCIWDKSVYQESPDKPAIFTYKVKLKAKVVIPEKDIKPGFLLEARLNRTVFRSGEKVKISIRPTQDAYIAIFNWTADDKISLLFPNQYLLNNLVQGGTWFTFPPEGSGLALKVETLPKHKQDTEALFVVALDKETGTSIPFCNIFSSGSQFKVANFFRKYIKLPIEKAIEKILIYEVRKERNE